MIKLKDLIKEIAPIDPVSPNRNLAWTTSGKEPKEIVDALHEIVKAVTAEGENISDWVKIERIPKSNKNSIWLILRPIGQKIADETDDSNYGLAFDDSTKGWAILWLPGKKLEVIDYKMLQVVVEGWITGF